MSSEVNQKNKIIEKCLISLANGDIDAMNLLYAEIKKDIYAFALSKVCNKFDAEDIFQDTFIRIYENAKLYSPKGKPMAWIFTIEVNVINRYYQVKSKREAIDLDLVINTIQDCKCEDTLSNNSISNDFLRNLLNNLNDLEREVISLHIVSELKFREIAELLNMPLSTILSKYNRAIKKIKKMVKEDKIDEKKSN